MTGLLSTFAIPVEQWRTGDRHVTELTYRPIPEPSNFLRRIWIDTDAACGYSRRTDPDDCFAIALLAQTSDIQVVGISTVFGTASLEAVNQTTIDLASRVSADLHRPLFVYSRYSQPLTENSPSSNPPAHRAFADALAQGPLTIVALGPLTNLAALIRNNKKHMMVTSTTSPPLRTVIVCSRLRAMWAGHASTKGTSDVI